MRGVVEEMRNRSRAALEALCRFVRDGLVSVQDAAASARADANEISRVLTAEG